MPIDNEFEKLTDEELDEKITKLQKILYSGNINLSLQARDILAQYKYEQEARLDKKLKEHFKKRNKDIENTEDIPINKDNIMNVKLSYDIDFAAIVIDERKMFPNIFDLQINVITATEDSYEQNIAFQRILFLIKEMFNNSIFVNFKNQNLKDIKQLMGNNQFVILPEDPYDQVIGFILFHKITAITEGRFEIDNLIISSKESDNIMYTIDDFSDFDNCEESDDHWWNRSDLSTSDNKEIENNISWEDIDLGWGMNIAEDETEIVFTADKKTPSIFILEGGKVTNEPEEK